MYDYNYVMNHLDDWRLHNIMLCIHNDRPLYYHLYSNIYNSYARKKKRGMFDREKAIKGLIMFVNQAVKYYKKRYGENISRVSMHDKKLLAEYALGVLNEWGLRNVRKGHNFREHVNDTIGTRDNIWIYIGGR